MPNQSNTPAPMSATLLALVRVALHDKQLRLTWDEAAALLADRDRLDARVERAESALCASLECTREELTAGFELGDAPGSDADPSRGVGFEVGEMDSGELELRLDVDGHTGSVYLSRAMYDAIGHQSGWVPSTCGYIGTCNSSRCPIHGGAADS